MIKKIFLCIRIKIYELKKERKILNEKIKKQSD